MRKLNVAILYSDPLFGTQISEVLLEARTSFAKGGKEIKTVDSRKYKGRFAPGQTCLFENYRMRLNESVPGQRFSQCSCQWPHRINCQSLPWLILFQQAPEKRQTINNQRTVFFMVLDGYQKQSFLILVLWRDLGEVLLVNRILIVLYCWILLPNS